MIPQNLLVKLFGGIPDFQTQPQFQMLGLISQTQESIHIISISFPHMRWYPPCRENAFNLNLSRWNLPLGHHLWSLGSDRIFYRRLYFGVSRIPGLHLKACVLAVYSFATWRWVGFIELANHFAIDDRSCQYSRGSPETQLEIIKHQSIKCINSW